MLLHFIFKPFSPHHSALSNTKLNWHISCYKFNKEDLDDPIKSGGISYERGKKRFYLN